MASLAMEGPRNPKSFENMMKLGGNVENHRNPLVMSDLLSHLSTFHFEECRASI